MNKEIKFVSKRSLPIAMWIAAGIVGFMLSLPISGIGGGEKYQGIQSSSSQLTSGRAAERDIEKLSDELDVERNETAKLVKELIDEKSYSQGLLQTVQRYRKLSGLTDLTGPGIIISISESEETIPGETERKPFIIHQEDLLNIVNELWHNDAEAIAVGSKAAGGAMERITNFSPFKCSGGAIEVNDKRMVPPFEIRAIGDPELLKTVITMGDQYLNKLSQLGIYTNVKISDSVYIPKYSGTIHMWYGQSILTEGDIIIPVDEDDSEDAQ